MTPTEIIVADAQRNGVDPNRLLSYVSQQIQSKKAVLMSANNSLLLIITMPDDTAELHLYTADSPLGLMKSVTEFINDIKRTGLKRVYGKADNQEILEMLKRLGVDVQPSDRPEFNWMASV
jgi:hypothetical protein